ncbi:hypothetical protein FraQA3DRAFT_2145 [Frankia sp. QA3]|nr:hypothetical protein FraQA3DRAFT_2145 [Frankia sp. QA3]
MTLRSPSKAILKSGHAPGRLDATAGIPAHLSIASAGVRDILDGLPQVAHQDALIADGHTWHRSIAEAAGLLDQREAAALASSS